MADEAPSTIRFTVLGPVTAMDGGVELALGPAKQRSVLAVLLLDANNAVTRDQIIDAVWGDSPPATAANLVAVYVAGLRKALEPGRAKGAASQLLTSTSTGYRLQIAPSQLDLLDFEDAVRCAREAHARGQLADCVTEYDSAMELWRGAALDGTCGPFVAAARQRLDDLRLSATEDQLDAALALGRHAGAVATLSRLVAAHPLRERLRGLLMLALYRSGRQAEALGVYDDTRRLLAEELGIDPGPDLQELHRSVLTADLAAPDDAEQLPVPSQLPADVADFTGRVAELDQLRAAFASESGGAVAVVAVTGSGGIGKTSLAVHAAHHLRDRFPDGQLFVNLQGARERPLDPHDVLAWFLRSLGLGPSTVPDDQEARAALYRTVVSERRLLIVLDDARDAAQLRPLLPGTARTGVLVTSRARLADLEGAQVLDLDVLTDEDALAVVARLAGPERVAAEPDAAADVVRACGRLPLALRIAGVRLANRPGWTIDALAGRLRDEESRLAELTAGDLGVRATFRVSYDNLDPAAARAFRLVSLPDGADIGLPAAAALLGQPEEEAEQALELLVDAHLVQAPAPHRYRYHDLLRLFARGMAGADEAIEARERALLYYLTAARAADRWIRPGRIPIGERRLDLRSAPAFTSYADATAWLAAERGNAIGIGLQSAADPAADPMLVAELAAELREFLHSRGRWQDWEILAGAALSAATCAGDGRATALASLELGILAQARHLPDVADEYLERSADLFHACDDGLGRARALNARGLSRVFASREAEAIEDLEQSLLLSRSHGDSNGEIATINNLALLHLRAGRHHEAIACARRSLELAPDGPRNHTIATLDTLGLAYGELGRHAEAFASHLEGYQLARATGDPYREGHALIALAKVQLRAGRLDDAMSYAERALAIQRDVGDRYGQARALEQLGRNLADLGHRARAVVCLREAMAIFTQLGAVEIAGLRTYLASLGPAVIRPDW